MRLKIWQCKEECGYAFMHLSFARKRGLKIDDYDCVWEGDWDCDTSLEAIFRKFNRVDEDDCEFLDSIGFRGHSLSTSDIVQLDDHYWYCDFIGWEDITNEIREIS